MFCTAISVSLTMKPINLLLICYGALWSTGSGLMITGWHYRRESLTATGKVIAVVAILVSLLPLSAVIAGSAVQGYRRIFRPR
jgi:hypothetical protein